MFESIRYVERISDLEAQLDYGSFLVLIAEETPFLELPKIEGVRLFGAIFPRIIFKAKTYAKGMLVAKLKPSTTIQIIDMDAPNSLIVSADTHSLLNIVDGFSAQIDDFVENIYSRLPQKAKMIGSGAGKTSFIQESVIFDTEHFYMNHAVVLTASSSLGIGVKHGWKALVGPFIATQCHGTILEQINFKDAFSVYKEAVEQDSDLRFSITPFFKISQRYPLGIVRYNRDFVVREPVKTDGKNIVVVGKLDENSVLSILKADKEDLLKAAKEAALYSRGEIEAHNLASVFVVDCLSRYLFLDKEFTKELKAIATAYPKETLSWGVVSLGEIANANEEAIEFYNNTCVVGTYEK